MDLRSQKEIMPPIQIPREKLSAEIIDALIEEFVLREGTDYGASELSLDKKKEQVLKQLDREDVCIVFDFQIATPTLVTAHEFKRLFKDL